MLLDKGYVQIYTGDGKGKTTAAIGLATRMAGAGGKVFIVRFMKGRPSSEYEALGKLDNVQFESFGSTNFVYDVPAHEDGAMAMDGLARAEAVICGGDYDLVILDEINNALDLELVPCTEVERLIRQKPAHVELVLTGRAAKPSILELADLVTEMTCIRHYYDSGVPSRKGIEE
jgi:cob(I)alamin adenosyltransferase